MSATHTDTNTLVFSESLEDLATDHPPPSAPGSSDSSFEPPAGGYSSDSSSESSAGICSSSSSSDHLEQPSAPPKSPHTPIGSLIPDGLNIEATPHKVTVAATRTKPDNPTYRVRVAEETSDPMGGLPFQPWIDHWVPGEDLDVSNLPEEFSGKKFDFGDLVFDEKEDNHIEYEEQMYPKLVRLPPFFQPLHGLISYL